MAPDEEPVRGIVLGINTPDSTSGCLGSQQSKDAWAFVLPGSLHFILNCESDQHICPLSELNYTPFGTANTVGCHNPHGFNSQLVQLVCADAFSNCPKRSGTQDTEHNVQDSKRDNRAIKSWACFYCRSWGHCVCRRCAQTEHYKYH